MKFRVRKETKRFRAFIVFGDPAWMPVDVQMNISSSGACMHSGFPTGRSVQMIMMSFHDVMRISCAIEGGNYKRRALLKPWGCHLGILVLSVWGLLTCHRPSTLAVSVPLKEKSITRMDSVTCLAICMHPDLSGEPSVSVTLVVWW